MHAGRRALAGGVQTGNVAAPVEVGEDAADRVVRGGRHRNGCPSGVVALLDEASHERREAPTVDRAQVEQDAPARRDLAGDDVARSELVGEAVALLVEEQGALPAKSLGEEQRRVHERRRMELDELEVGERGTGAIRGGHPLPDSARRVRGPLPESCRAAGGEERGPCGDLAPVGDDADAALVVAPDRGHLLALDHRDPRMGEDALCELARDSIARRRAARVNDASAAVTALEPEALVELDAELDEIADPCRGLLREHRDGARPAQAAARAQRVLGVQRRVVVLPHGCRDSALGEEARRGEERPLGEDENVALGGSAERREETGDASADDDERQLLLPSSISPCAHGSFRL